MIGGVSQGFRATHAACWRRTAAWFPGSRASASPAKRLGVGREPLREGDLGQPDEGARVGALAGDGQPFLGGRVEEAAAQVHLGEPLAALARVERRALEDAVEPLERGELLDAEQRLERDERDEPGLLRQVERRLGARERRVPGAVERQLVRGDTLQLGVDQSVGERRGVSGGGVCEELRSRRLRGDRRVGRLERGLARPRRRSASARAASRRGRRGRRRGSGAARGCGGTRPRLRRCGRSRRARSRAGGLRSAARLASATDVASGSAPRTSRSVVSGRTGAM